MTVILKFPILLTIYLALATKPVQSADIADFDGLVVNNDTTCKVEVKGANVRNPKTATILATVPGLGQFYNRDLWKIPIVYASLGGSILSYYLNALKYGDYLKAYLSFYDLNTGNIGQGFTPETQVPVTTRNLFNTKSSVQMLTRDQVVRYKNVWRRNKNLSIIAIGFIYALTIIEANVSAHLKTFDVSDDISVQISPDFMPMAVATFNARLQIVFNFK